MKYLSEQFSMHRCFIINNKHLYFLFPVVTQAPPPLFWFPTNHIVWPRHCGSIIFLKSQIYNLNARETEASGFLELVGRPAQLIQQVTSQGKTLSQSQIKTRQTDGQNLRKDTQLCSLAIHIHTHGHASTNALAHTCTHENTHTYTHTKREIPKVPFFSQS